MFAALKLLPMGAKIGMIIAFFALLASVAAISYNKGLNVSKVEIAKYETKLSDLRTKLVTAQDKVDVRVVTEYKDRIVEVDRVVTKNRDVIYQTVPAQFTLSKGWIYAYNQSIKGLEIDPVKSSDKRSSSLSEMMALADTIAPNNGVCLTNKAKLDALQKWVKETGEVSETVSN